MKHFRSSVHIRAATLREPTYKTYLENYLQKKQNTVVRQICVKELNQHCKRSVTIRQQKKCQQCLKEPTSSFSNNMQNANVDL